MNNFQSNLRVLANNYTQKYIAEKTGFSQSSINNYLTKNSEPSIQFLIALNSAFNISIDDFLFGDISKSEVDDTVYDKYLGNYLVYYFNNSYYKGEVHNNYKNTLSYGVISVVRENLKIKVYAEFTKERKDAINILKKLNSFDDIGVISYYKKQENIYKGYINVNEENIFINISNFKINDSALFVFNNPPSVKKYLGGLGTVNSISRGREHVPCVQYILLSQTALSLTDGEIYNLLSLEVPDLNIKNELNELVELIKTLYIAPTKTGLNEHQQKRILEDSITNIISSQIDANMFRFAKVTNMEDDNYYRILKESSDDWLPKNIWWYGWKIKQKK